LKHPVTRLRMEPLSDAIEHIRAKTLITMVKSPLKVMIDKSLSRQEKR
jgi:hypothetical protein